MYNNELYHHGILGQKWGKQNGPPYPLKQSKHSASEKKAGWKKSLSKGESAKDYQKQLNKMDKARDPYRRTMQEAHATREAIKEWAKTTGRYEQEDDGYTIKFNKSKRDQNIAKRFLDAGESANEAAIKYEKGTKEVLKTLDKLEKKGYTISSKEVQRLSMNGKDYTGLLVAGLGTVAAATVVGLAVPPASSAALIKGASIGAAVGTAGALDHYKVKGFKYKVTPPKSK